MASPDESGAPSFERDIKPLFRPKDREAMLRAFDLFDYDDVVDNADAILESLRGGTMPCDGAWPLDRIGVFQRWAESGCQP